MKTRLLMLAAALLVLPASALGSPMTFDLAPADNSFVLPGDDPLVPDFNDGSYFTFDLMITTVGTYFLAASVDATLTGPSQFFQHPAGGLVPPDPNVVQQYPAVEFDSFFDGGPADRIWVEPSSLVQETQFIHADWAVQGGGQWDDTYRIARFTFHFSEPGTATFQVSGSSWDTVNYHLHRFGPITVDVEYVPEPGTLGLLALAGLLLARRGASPVLAR